MTKKPKDSMEIFRERMNRLEQLIPEWSLEEVNGELVSLPAGSSRNWIAEKEQELDLEEDTEI